MTHVTIGQFLPAINNLPTNTSLTKQDLLTQSFLMETDDHLSMYYAPHNDYIHKQAQIVIIGITPGWQQMRIAFEQFVSSYTSGLKIDLCLYQAKKAAGFSGTLRENLVDMLDQCDIPNSLNIANSSSLFKENRTLLHTTSILKYPVFLQGRNYTGHKPKIDQSSLLKHYAYKVFPEELSHISSSAILIPLGKAVEKVILELAERKLLDHHYLTGFPHPSGANGHRKKQFKENKKQLREKVVQWMINK